ncbi:MAG: DUF6542 domain-containing protein [Candidatus Nanopelagicales bacterium]
MSSDQVPGAPSFGDLFDDPDAPLPSSAPPARPSTPVEPAAPHDEAPAPEDESPEPVGAVEPDPADVAFASPYTADDAPAARPTSYDAPAAEVAAAAAMAEPAAPAAAAAAAWDGSVDPAASSAPATRVDTGRLYRSAGAEGPATLDAIPAIDPSYVPRAAAVPAADLPSPDVTPTPVRGGGRGLTYSGVAVVVIAVTVLVAFADALINDKLGIVTGVALAVSSVYAAVTVRRADIWAAVVMPPLAFFVAAITAGQLTLDSSGSLVLREAYMLFRTLAVNAPWIIGTTLVCLVIVLVRRARS